MHLKCQEKVLAKGIVFDKISTKRMIYLKKVIPMIVYIDVLFTLALLQDFLLLFTVGACMKEKTKFWRIILGGIIGALYRIMNVFCSLNSVILSVLVAFLQIITAYGREPVKLTLSYITIAVLTAGIMQITSNEYYGVLFVLCMLFMPYIVLKIRRGIFFSKLNHSLKIIKDGKEIMVQGFLDSGNSSGMIIIGCQHAKELLGRAKADAINSLKEGDYTLSVCNTVKGDVLIPVITADSVIADGEKINVKIGVVKEKMSYALLPAIFLEMRDSYVDRKVGR